MAEQAVDPDSQVVIGGPGKDVELTTIMPAAAGHRSHKGKEIADAV